MKHCPDCGILKNRTEFGKNRSRNDGLHGICKKCDRIRRKDWYTNNQEKALEYARDYKTSNRGKLAAKEAKRRASKLQRTPSYADLKVIEEFYHNCPEGYHVDHIVPLQGELVSGLHILKNLQYLPALENIRKSNTFRSI